MVVYDYVFTFNHQYNFWGLASWVVGRILYLACILDAWKMAKNAHLSNRSTLVTWPEHFFSSFHQKVELNFLLL